MPIIRPLLALAGLSTLLAAAAPAAAQTRYAEGQTWSYRTRPQDEGSLLRIQRIEPFPGAATGERIYHISVIGVRLGPDRRHNSIGHLPVSQATLDASVTTPAVSQSEFPNVEEGIAEWREARGGVFDISVAEIVAAIDGSISEQIAAAPKE